MTERDQVSALLLRIDNLIRTMGTLSTELVNTRSQNALFLARIENIERSLAVPLNYTVKQAVRRLNYSLDWGYRHLSDLVTPVSRDPLLFPIADIEALAVARPKRGRAEKEKIAG